MNVLNHEDLDVYKRQDHALSAGAYIALCCDKIAMMPGSTLGDAEMLINGTTRCV